MFCFWVVVVDAVICFLAAITNVSFDRENERTTCSLVDSFHIDDCFF